jgi:hypothetical protein
MLPVIQDEIIDVTGKESRVIKIWREKNKWDKKRRIKDGIKEVVTITPGVILKI